MSPGTLLENPLRVPFSSQSAIFLSDLWVLSPLIVLPLEIPTIILLYESLVFILFGLKELVLWGSGSPGGKQS